MITVQDAFARVRRVPPRRLPGVLGRYALRTARARARRWQQRRQRGELSDAAFARALRGQQPDQIFAHLVERFFVDPTEARRRADAIARAYPGLAERTRHSADQAIAHVVDLLGSGPLPLGPRIDWHRDFKTGHRWPRDVLAEDQDYLRLNEPCDVKMPWELSRCHHWVALGRAYALEPDPRYAGEFITQLEAWLDDNSWPYGVNWGRAMEVAVRAVNWLWAAAFFADAPEFGPRPRVRLLKALIQHARHIIDNLEFADVNGNHYLSNGVGLLFLGVLLEGVAESAAWRRKGEEIVWGELPRQVFSDGVDFEQGLGYQGLVAEFWYSSLALCERNGLLVPSHVRPRLDKMFDFMLAYTRPDGTFPQIGDNDDGRLAGTDDEPVGSHLRHLAVGAALFSRPDLRAAAADAVETAVWLCGPAVLAMPASPAALASQAFPEGGFFILRADDSVMVVDAGEVGMHGIGGHGHNDVLSFDLWAAGAPLLVDSGTYTYTADPPARQLMRSTAAHNTVRVDGEEIARLGSTRWLWQIANDARPTVVRWSSDAQRDVIIAEHSGYQRLPNPVTHRRSITLFKAEQQWRVDDTLVGDDEHLAEIFFHPGVPFDLFPDAASLHAPSGDLWLFVPGGTTLRQEDGWISRGYGHRAAAPVLLASIRAALPVTLTTRLVLVPPGTPAHQARSLVQNL
jgi:hypothetical protein